MADGISADFAEVNRLAADLGEVSVNAGRYVRAAVEVSSRHVKDDARKSVRSGNKRWKALPRAIDYEVKTLQAFGVSVIESEVGYDKETDAGKLGNIREHGSTSATPHNDLRNALEKNQKDFENGLDKALQDAERVLNGGSSVTSAAAAVIRGRFV